MTLVEFLTARLAEDEALAHAAAVGYAERSVWRTAGGTICDGTGEVVVYDSIVSRQVVAHIARHDPARVLRDVEAKRSTIDDLIDLMRADGQDSGNALRREWARDALHHLATVYADHPNYASVWRP